MKYFNNTSFIESSMKEHIKNVLKALGPSEELSHGCDLHMNKFLARPEEEVYGYFTVIDEETYLYIDWTSSSSQHEGIKENYVSLEFPKKGGKVMWDTCHIHGIQTSPERRTCKKVKYEYNGVFDGYVTM